MGDEGELGGVGQVFEDEDVRALYREPPERFVAARDALAAKLRETEQGEHAAVVKALRRPTVPAWAVNRLADREPESIAALLDAGAEVRAAQQAALSSSRHADRLREATTARREVVSRLTRLADGFLREAGRSTASHLDDVRATLEAASVDPDAAERLRAGTLDRPVRESAGLGDVLGLRSVPDEEPSPAETSAVRAEEPARVELDRLRRDRDAASRDARRAREAADRLTDRVSAMEARLSELRDKREAAEATARGAELESKRADDALRRASKSR